MKEFILFQRGLLHKVAQTGTPPAITRTIHILEDKVAIFTKLVPWPALAASFEQDLQLLRNSLSSTKDSHEPQDRESATRS